ncbi:MAG TPA: spermidine/putrescine ABC transporter substrate-binding protein [Opitutaceae bacterium]
MKHLSSLFGATASVALVLFFGGCGSKKPTLSLFIWEEYMDPEVLAEFEAETGIRVVESNFGSNEDLLAKLQVGAGGYDVIVPTDYMVQVMKRQELLAVLDHSKLPGLANLHRRFRKLPFDPGQEVSVPFQWGVTGIAYNASSMSNPPTSWAEFFDLARIAPAKGRISLLNDAREVLGAALIALGKSPNTREEGEVAAAAALVAAQKPFVAKFDSESFEDSLAAGETILIQGWSGEVTVAMEENEDVRYLIPTDGALAFVDNLAIPASSKQTDAAHQLIDFLLRPDIAARIANFTYYGTCNEPARENVEEFLRKGPPFMWPEEDKTHYLEDLGEEGEVYDRTWTELKTL